MSKIHISILILLAGMLILSVGYVCRIFHHGELANKPIWAAMQSFAAKEEFNPPYTRNMKIEPVFFKGVIKYKKILRFIRFANKR